jgi:hypothetical protein
MYCKSFAEQHPILLSFGILFGAAFLVALWPVFLAVALLGGTGYLICAAAAVTQRYNAHHAARRQALAARADYEHWLLSRGHPAGVYGPVPASQLQ